MHAEYGVGDSDQNFGVRPTSVSWRDQFVASSDNVGVKL